MSRILGPTGNFPQGKVGPDDEGGLMIQMTNWNGVVRIDFGAPVTWLGLPPDEAIEFAKKILKQAGVKKVTVIL
jgi:hypothetical protein